jgi:hypothetical protein
MSGFMPLTARAEGELTTLNVQPHDRVSSPTAFIQTPKETAS